MDNNKTVLPILVVFILITIVGFYVAFDKIASLTTSLSNLELTQELKNKSGDTSSISQGLNVLSANPIGVQQSATSTNTASQQSQSDLVAKISTAIIFDTNSSSALLPQASTTITIDNVSKMKDGTIRVEIKAFTNNASSYTAIDPNGLFLILDTDGNGEPASQINGEFKSMPPKSSVSGQIIFKPSSDRNSYIIQMGIGDDTKFYEFDFVKKSYKETIIG